MLAGITKLEIAKRQVDTAIRMFFLDEDPISVHTLAMAPYRVLRDLGETAGCDMHQWFKDWIVPEHVGEFWAHVNRFANGFKHADRPDKDPNFDEFDPQLNEFALMICGKYYKDLTGKATPEMITFTYWMFATRPRFVSSKDPTFKAQVEEFAKTFSVLPRGEQLKSMKLVLERARSGKLPSVL